MGRSKVIYDVSLFTSLPPINHCMCVFCCYLCCRHSAHIQQKRCTRIVCTCIYTQNAADSLTSVFVTRLNSKHYNRSLHTLTLHHCRHRHLRQLCEKSHRASSQAPRHRHENSRPPVSTQTRGEIYVTLLQRVNTRLASLQRVL